MASIVTEVFFIVLGRNMTHTHTHKHTHTYHYTAFNIEHRLAKDYIL